MEMYNCKVRLGGSVSNEVPKANASAAEIIVLRHLHGAEAVIDIDLVSDAKVAHQAVRDDLAKVYGEAVVEELFGPAHRDLPIKLPQVPGTAKRGAGRPAGKVSADDLAA